MNQMLINYAVMLICAGIIVRELYLLKQNGRLRIVALLASIVVLALAAFASFKGVPISQLQVMIEQMFS